MRFRRRLGLLAGLGLLVNFAAQWHLPHAVEFSSEATRVSAALLEGRGFSDPFLTGEHTGPTAYIAPVYPILHAAICEVFGTQAAGWAAVVAVTALAWALQWACVWWFADRYGHGRAGLAAALIGTLLPLPGRLYKWEMVFVGAALAVSACLVSRVLAEEQVRFLPVWLGLAIATTVLLSPPVILVWMAWGILLLMKLGAGRAVRMGAIACAVAAVPVGAWTVRNFALFHHVFFVRDAGLAFSSSNTGCATPLLSQNIASRCFANNFPTGSKAAMQQFEAVGEYDYDQVELGRATAWAGVHPRRFLELTAGRAFYFWFPLENSDGTALVYGLFFSACTILSLLAISWAGSDGLRILLGVMAAFPLAYYLAQEELRYRYPMLWVSILLACVGFERVLRRLRLPRPATSA